MAGASLLTLLDDIETVALIFSMVKITILNGDLPADE
ncbi:hypothetical protein VIOR103205_10005 [Vibrio ordalii]